jgi:hypothetical protein
MRNTRGARSDTFQETRVGRMKHDDETTRDGLRIRLHVSRLATR